MTAPATGTRKPRPRRRIPGRPDGDRLVPFSAASERLGRSTDTLREWHDEGNLPAVVTPGSQWMTFESFIASVLASARPGKPGDIAALARAWFAAHPAMEGVVA